MIQTPGGGPLLSFHNLVDANVLVALRWEHRIPMGQVCQAVEAAKERLGAERPLLLDLKAGEVLLGERVGGPPGQGVREMGV